MFAPCSSALRATLVVVPKEQRLRNPLIPSNKSMGPRRPSGVAAQPSCSSASVRESELARSAKGALIRLLRCLGCHSPFGSLDILNIAPEGGKNKSIKRRRNRPTKIKIGCQTAPAPLRGLLLELIVNRKLIRTNPDVLTVVRPSGVAAQPSYLSGSGLISSLCRPEGTIRACFMVRINCLLSAQQQPD